jgi:hypothetical protein
MSAVDNTNSILNQIKNVIVNQLKQPNQSSEQNKQDLKGDKFTKS